MFVRGTTTTAAALIVVATLLGACGGKVERDWVGSSTGEPTGSGGTGGTVANTDGTGGTAVLRPEGPSCSGMTGTECNGESCCTSIVVPRGSFLMGRGTEICRGCTDGCPSEMSCQSEEQPEHTATVSSFYLDKYELTVGRFLAFVEGGAGTQANPPLAGSGAHPLIAGSGWDSSWDTELPVDQAALTSAVKCSTSSQTWTDTAEANETYPVNYLSWYVAFAFCIWDGSRLPTEAEWEYAAARGDENRVYPWGNDVTVPLPANYDGNHGRPFVSVGSEPLGNGRWGHADLAGSMNEWVLDWFASDWYTTTQTGCWDCANLSDASYRVRRGGFWRNRADELRAAFRFGLYLGGLSGSFGARCARSAP